MYRVDRELGYFFKLLEEEDLLKQTNIILTSDHGDSLHTCYSTVISR